jgi:uncharacterized DUF497 family protein
LTELLAARSIIDLDFEWDDTKAAENVRNHGVSFAQAALAFRDEQDIYYRQNAP